jgi:hypothetical protein
MNTADLAEPDTDTGAERAVSLEASDDFNPAHPSGRYCPTELLGTFTLLMAGHGHCVNSSMMLGDREYAMWQLAKARTLDDIELRRVAQRLFAYFDDPRGWGAAHRG